MDRRRPNRAYTPRPTDVSDPITGHSLMIMPKSVSEGFKHFDMEDNIEDRYLKRTVRVQFGITEDQRVPSWSKGRERELLRHNGLKVLGIILRKAGWVTSSIRSS